MNTLIQPTGYVIADNEAIHGLGDTVDLAWADFKANMDAAQTTVIEPCVDVPTELENWVLETDFRCLSASASLLAQVEREGGAIGWGYYNGIACTIAEEDAIADSD